MTAGADTVVHPGPARALHSRLAPLYEHAPDRLRHREFPDAGHMMPPEAWGEARRDAADWLERFLGEGVRAPRTLR